MFVTGWQVTITVTWMSELTLHVTCLKIWVCLIFGSVNPKWIWRMYNNESFSGITKRFQFFYGALALNTMYQGVFQKRRKYLSRVTCCEISTSVRITYHQRLYQNIWIICPNPSDQSFKASLLLTVSLLFPISNCPELDFSTTNLIQLKLNKVAHICMC